MPKFLQSKGFKRNRNFLFKCARWSHVLDQWFSQVVRQHCRGYCSIIRYADDTLVLFEREDDAHRFMRVLPLRLAKYGLTLNQTKTQLLCFGK